MDPSKLAQSKRKIFMTSSYDSLAIKRVINANATLTKLEGSLMPEEVIMAMVEASRNLR